MVAIVLTGWALGLLLDAEAWWLVAVGQAAALLALGAGWRRTVEAGADDDAVSVRHGVILETLSEGVIAMDPDHRVVLANRAAAELLGMSQDELVGRPADGLLTCPDTGGDAPLPFDMVMAERQTIAGIALCQRGPRESIAVETTVSPVADERRIIGAVQTLRDVQAERDALSALERSEREARAVIETAGDAFVSIDADGTVLEWNAAAYRTFGWTAEQAIGRTLTELLIPERYRAAHQAGLARHLATGESRILEQRLELQALHADGRERDVELVIWRVDRADGPRFNAFLRDVTERVEARRALLDRQHQMSQAEELAHIGSWVWDVATDAVTWSPGMYRLTGACSEHTPGFDTWTASVHDQDRSRALEAIRSAVRGDAETFEVEYRVQQDDRVGHQLAVGRIERDDAGRPRRVIGLVRDVTAEREAQRIRDELTAVATHELKTPLTSIRGALSLMESAEVGADLSPGLREMVSVASRNAERLVDLADRMLDIERLASQEVAVDERPVELRSFLDETLRCMEGLARSQGVHLRSEGHDVDTAVFDRGQMQQVVTNLISNAIKFSDAGQTVGVTARRGPDRALVIEVVDQGRGIPTDQLRAVFERFRQVNPRSATERSGSGLGLSIVEEIVAHHGGTVEAISAGLGTGTTMRVTLPGRLAPPGGDPP